ncbi:MAG: 1-acyl-sn-glycerol-3-phosphate acyltransferase [Alteromonadaceae bacterium]|jgi:1-acyl-sn-glycerol-3-phosphate acyltransferase|tara:strand:- start:4017 stop:4643 length:627 start_codon:yes stop_codon:yes gene_type:complete
MLFYRFEQQWISPEDKQQWDKVNFIIFLNHTSLFEPLFLRLAPFSFLWRIASDLLVPGADITMARPIIGKIYRILIPGCIPITRKKDDSWDHFLSHVDNEKVNAILPEGRMKRRGGLDKTGQPMSIRGGVVDILQRLDKGEILFVYSGGLHHIQAPGDKFPRLFKTIKVNLELIDLPTYKQQFSSDNVEFRQQVLTDISQRLSTRIPQ